METFIFPLHILSLIFVAWNIVLADHMGFEWIRGKISMLNKEKVSKYHIRTWIGLICMILTGSLLFWGERSYFLERIQFLIKMAFVIILICNGVVIGYLQKIAVTKKWNDLTLRQKLPLLISGAISTTAWIGAFIAAFFISGS
jgi:hypothetical protein